MVGGIYTFVSFSVETHDLTLLLSLSSAECTKEGMKEMEEEDRNCSDHVPRLCCNLIGVFIVIPPTIAAIYRLFHRKSRRRRLLKEEKKEKSLGKCPSYSEENGFQTGPFVYSLSSAALDLQV